MTQSYSNNKSPLRSNFLDILVARDAGNKQAVHEASLSRVMQHAGNADTTGFAILTSWRQNLSKPQNISRFAQLKAAVRGKGLGFNTLQGHWRECQDSTVSYEDCPPDQLVDAVEPSLFITGISMEDAQALGNAYDQDAVVFAGPETQGRVVLVFRSGDTMDIGSFSPMSIGQAYSELRTGGGKTGGSKPGQGLGKVDRNFRFEYVSWPTQGHVESLMEQSYRSVREKQLRESGGKKR